jgi:gliding motility-associated-like protein
MGLQVRHLMKMILFLCACVCTGHSIFAQLEASQWYFGEYAGLDFRSGTPLPLTNGALNTLEGSASIADQYGNLLFYTDGVTVYNRLHQPMSNGSNLWGHFSTTQTLIVPHPTNDGIYYIFTASPEHNSWFGAGVDSVGLHYSVVDITEESGLGLVIEKNILLFRNTTEKISATYHRNGKDVWVVTHEWGTNNFRSYLITETGLNSNAVISSIGSVHEGGGHLPSDNRNATGQMKISPDGSVLGLVIGWQNKAEVFFFDNDTGRVTVQLSSFSVHSENQISEYYGLEFSPNANFIYFTITTNCEFNDPEYPSELWQYSIANDQSEKVGEFIGSMNALQLALDGKIYISRCNNIIGESSYMATINNPNRKGRACNFEGKATFLNSKNNKLGLPNFIQSYFLFPDPVVDMPNVFTPNGDLYNPVFKPAVFENMLEADLQIINRWGQRIFYSQDVPAGWNGGDAASGVYYWLMRYEGKNGKMGTVKGWVHLIR